MKKILAIALFLVGSIVFAEEPPPITGVDHKEGNVCLYEYNMSGKKVVLTQTTIRVDAQGIVLESVEVDGSKKDGLRFESILTPDGKAYVQHFFMATGDKTNFEPPSPWFSFPLQPAAKWPAKKTVRGNDGKSFVVTADTVHEVGKWAKLKVRAGEFMALQVKAKETFSGQDHGNRVSGTGTFSYWLTHDTPCILKGEYKNNFNTRGSFELIK